LKINTLEGKSTNNSVRWYGHALRMIKERIPEKLLNTTAKGKHLRVRLRSRWVQQLRKTSHRKKKEPGNKLRFCGKPYSWRGLVFR
jgi:hypothetical protein